MIRTVFLALFLFNSAGTAAAQSFNCAKATTPTEKLICADPELGDLDSNLSAKLKRAIHTVPAERDSLLADERQWVAARDGECSAAIKSSDDRGLYCLKKSYQSRIETLQGKMPREKADATLCQRFVDLYRAATANDRPPASRESANPLMFLVRSDSAAGKISVTEPTSIWANKKEVQAWAARQDPPAKIPTYLLETMTETPDWRMGIVRLPGTNFYAAHVVAGTGYCYNSTFFTVSNGRAHGAENPAAWENGEASNCGAIRYFGVLDRTLTAFEINGRPFSPNLEVSISIMAWNGDHFAPSCTAELNFAPHFDANGPLSHSAGEEEECAGRDCEALKKRALALVEDVQKNPYVAERTARAQLTPEQMAKFVALKNPAAAEAERTGLETSARPEDLLDTAPLVLPLIREGRVYRVEIGHTTMGWRIWKDWKVAFKDEDRESVFYIGMENGNLIDATVK